MKRLNNDGLSIKPCFTPTFEENDLVNPDESLTVEYMIFCIFVQLTINSIFLHLRKHVICRLRVVYVWIW